MSTHGPRQAYLTAAERVAQELRTAITTGSLASGAPIRQEDIAAQYQVSRMPVREAFRQLEAEGLLVIYPSRGAFVATLAPSDILEIYEIRSLLEVDALRRACAAPTADSLEQAAAILDQLDVEHTIGRWSKLDEAFHTTIYAPARRPRLLEMIATLRRQVTHFYYLAVPLATFRDASQREHRHILAACQAGDVGGAVAALKQHLQRSAHDHIAAIQQQRVASEQM